MSVVEGKLWTAHIHSDELPFIGTGVPGMEFRILHYREDEQMIASQVIAAPFTVSNKHQHLGPAHAVTFAGCWGHDHEYEYVKGTYIFEPIGVIHQFFSGPEPVNAYFMSYGQTQYLNEETGELSVPRGVDRLVSHYFERCEEQGLPRPNILRV